MLIRNVGARIAPILIVSLVILSAIQAPHRQGLMQGGIQGLYFYSEEGSWVSQFTLRTGTYTYPNGSTMVYNYIDVSPFRVFALRAADPRFSNFSIEASSDYISPPNSLELRFGSGVSEDFSLYLGLRSGSAPNLSNGIVYGAEFYIKISDLYVDPQYIDPSGVSKTLRLTLSICPLSSVTMNMSACIVYSDIYIIAIYNGSGYVLQVFPALINTKYQYEPYVNIQYMFRKEYNTTVGSWLNLRLLMIYNASTGRILVAVEADGKTVQAVLLNPLDQRFLDLLASDPIAGIGFEMSNVVPYLAGNTTIRIDDFGLFYGKGWFSEEALLGYTQTTTEYYPPPPATTTNTQQPTWTWTPPQIYTVTVTERVYITVPTPVYITASYPYTPMPQSIPMATVTATAAETKTQYITVEKRYTEALSTTTITISRLITQQIRSEGGITDTGLIIATAITAIAIITASMIRTRKKQ
ncbi:MAG: hypothetical protein QXQ96_10215 [Sulfolobales archaeon]